MRAFGITYDIGFTSAGTTTREPFDPAVVDREMQVIRAELCCDAVRITGGDPDRLETAARYAAGAGLEIWYSPFTNGLTQTELLDFLAGSAGRAERLRRAPRSPSSPARRSPCSQAASSPAALPPSASPTRNGFGPRCRASPPRSTHSSDMPSLRCERSSAAGSDTPRCHSKASTGRPSTSSPPTRSTDARTAGRLADGLRALTAHGKPAAVTEFGCTTYRGAADSGGWGDSVIEWDDRARPVRFTTPVVRDEEEQARYLCALLGEFDRSAVDVAFVNTFARYDLTHNDADDDRDFDKASFGIVKILDGGRTGAAYPGLPWEPKAAFHAIANYGRGR